MCGKELEIVGEFQIGKSLDELTSNLSQTRYSIPFVTNFQANFGKLQTKRSKRSRLLSAYKLIVRNEYKIGMKTVDIQLKFKMSPGTYY